MAALAGFRLGSQPFPVFCTLCIFSCSVPALLRLQFCLIFHLPCTELGEPLEVPACHCQLDLPSQRGTASPKCLFGCFCIVRTLGTQVAVPAVCFRDPSSHYRCSVQPASVVGSVATTGRTQLWSDLAKMDGTAWKNSSVLRETTEASGRSDSGVLLVFECEGLKLILNTWTPMSHCFPSQFTSLHTLPAGRLCGTRIETLAMMHRGISLPATALRSPNSGVKLPLLASPLFPMETTPSAPAPAVLT